MVLSKTLGVGNSPFYLKKLTSLLKKYDKKLISRQFRQMGFLIAGRRHARFS